MSKRKHSSKQFNDWWREQSAGYGTYVKEIRKGVPTFRTTYNGIKHNAKIRPFLGFQEDVMEQEILDNFS